MDKRQIGFQNCFLHIRTTNSLKFTMSTPIEDYSIAMLSPPLSPYPRQTELLSKQSQAIAHKLVNDTKLDEPFLVTPPQKKRQLEPAVSIKPVATKKRAFTTNKFNPRTPLISNAWSGIKKDPVGYYARQRAYLEMYTLHGPSWSNYVSVDHGAPKQSGSVNGSYLQSRAARQARASAAAKRRIAATYNSDADTSGSENAIFTRSSVAAARNASAAPESVSKTSRPTTPVRQYRSNASSPAPSKVHDMALSQITDYSPSADALPNNKALRAEWKGVPMDLSQDPNIHLMHPAEIHLASVLRLPADIYLDSKRRLFAEKVHRLRQGLPFRRTDSQKACRIDVNKASRLFSAYEKVGWLDDAHFKKYL